MPSSVVIIGVVGMCCILIVLATVLGVYYGGVACPGFGSKCAPSPGPAPGPAPAPTPGPAPGPAPAPSPTPSTTSSYEPEPYFKE